MNRAVSIRSKRLKNNDKNGFFTIPALAQPVGITADSGTAAARLRIFKSDSGKTRLAAIV
jgi:hypothetical protein